MNTSSTVLQNINERYKILLIEDNAGDALIVEDYILEYLPSSVVVQVKTLRESLEIIEQSDSSFDVVLLDLNLPDKSGTALIEAVISVVGETPVVVLTGLVDHSFSIKSLKMGVTDYLLKGEFNAFALYKSVVYAVEKGKMNRKMAEKNKRLRGVLEIARLGHWNYDRESSVLHCSDDMKRMLQLNSDTDKLSIE